MKLCIVGAGRSGKDTASEYLRDHYGLRYTHGTSQWAAKIVWAHMTKTGHGYDTPDECWEDRHNHRQLWANIIGRHNADDPCRMYRECLTNQDILSGLRWLNEFRACVNERLFDYSIWIERPGVWDDTTCQITAGDCDYQLKNDGSLELFFSRIDRLAESLGLTKIKIPLAIAE